MGYGVGSFVAGIVIICVFTVGYVASNSANITYNHESHDKSIIYKDDREYSFTCTSNNRDYINLQPFNSSVTFKNVKLTNCSYPSSILWEVLSLMKISTAHLVLENWTMDDSLNFVNLSKLEILEIRGAKSNSTDISFRSLSNLTDLHIVSSGLTTQHIELPNKLKMINISTNNLKTLKEDFLHNLTQLQTFIVSNNKIKELPRHVFGQNTLRVLDLSKNQISDLPVELFANLTGLRELYLQENAIERLELGLLTNLVNLTILNLRFNKIQTVPIDIQYLSSLSKLYFGHNRLSNIDSILLSSSMTTLDFSYNNFTSRGLCHGDISSLSQLEHLEVQHNKLNRLCASWPYLWRLTMLNVSHNYIPDLTYDEFKFLNSNITVDYSYNKITAIDFLEENPMISDGKRFYIQGNPFLCDGRMFWFIRLAHEKKMFGTTVQDAECQYPSHLKGRRLSSFNPDELPEFIMCGTVKEDLGSCTCTYQKDIKEFRVNCSSEDADKLWTFNTEPEMYKVVFVVENGQLVTLPATLPTNVTAIYAAHNNISEVPVFSNKLECIDLSDNRISYVPPEAVDRLISDDTRLNLANNSLVCDCKNSYLINKMYLYHYNVLDYEMIVCANGTSLSSLQLPLLCDVVAVWILVLIVLAVLVAVCVVVFGVCYKYNYEIKSLLYSRGWLLSLVLQEELDKTKQYDAFVSYAHGDEDFITDELLPMLEGEPHKFSLCVHHRDWLPGADIPSQIVQSVEDSRRTIVVLSQNFVKSVWGRAEFRAATAETVRTGLPRVLVIMLHDIETLNDVDPELKAYLATNTYLERGDPLFWEKLSYALPHRNHGKRSHFLEPMSAEEQRLRRKQLKPIVDFVEKEFAKQREMGIDNVIDSDDIKNGVVKLNGVQLGNDTSNSGTELQQCNGRTRLE